VDGEKKENLYVFPTKMWKAVEDNLGMDLLFLFNVTGSKYKNFRKVLKYAKNLVPLGDKTCIMEKNGRSKWSWSFFVDVTLHYIHVRFIDCFLCPISKEEEKIAESKVASVASESPESRKMRIKLVVMEMRFDSLVERVGRFVDEEKKIHKALEDGGKGVPLGEQDKSEMEELKKQNEALALKVRELELKIDELESNDELDRLRRQVAEQNSDLAEWSMRYDELEKDRARIQSKREKQENYIKELKRQMRKRKASD